MTEHAQQYQKAQRNDVRVVSLQNGALPPQAIDVEEAVLGAMMIDVRTPDEALMLLKTPDVFYKDANKCIFQAIQALYDESAAIDIITVSSKLRAMGMLEMAGGDYNIITLSQKISSSAHIEIHARILLQMYIKRSIIKTSSTLMALAYDATVDTLELMQQWSDSLDVVTGMTMTGQREITYAAALDNVEKRIEQLSSKTAEALTGVDTGFKKINEQTAGYQPGELIIVGARPGMGKSAYMLRPVIKNAVKGVPVGIISLEMSVYEVVSRTVAIDTNFHLRQITKIGFQKNEYFSTFSKHKHRMKEYPIYIDDSATADIRDVAAKIRLWVRKYGVKFVVVDYLQLMMDSSKKFGNREGELSSISRKMKLLAKELGIPIMALCQLSRAVETRGSSKRPLLSDLRESGAIEQDANIVTFLWRPGYYNIEVPEELEEIGADSEAIFAKYRGGAPFEAGLKWIGDHTKYIDPDEWLAEKEAQDFNPGGNEDWDRVARERAASALPTANDAFGNDETKPPF